MCSKLSISAGPSGAIQSGGARLTQQIRPDHHPIDDVAGSSGLIVQVHSRPGEALLPQGHFTF